MKRSVSVFCFLLFFCGMLFPVCGAAEGNSDTLANWNVRIDVPEGTKAVLKGSEYYIYAGEENSIPYVMLRTYPYDDAETLLNDFTGYMRKQYPDLKVTADAAGKTIGDKQCFEIDYSYQVSGYEVRDRRIALTAGGTSYMFASKEIEEIGMTIGSMLDDIVANCVLLAEEDLRQSSGIADGYLYCQENGMPKYWLDFSWTLTDNLVLHGFFRSGSEAFSESCFVLDLSSAEISENGLTIRQIRDMDGNDCSGWFEKLIVQLYLDAAVMTVERDGNMLSGGPEENILAGTYLMVPVGVSGDSLHGQNHFRPAGDGPYQAEELGVWARFYCFRNTGIFPAAAETIENPDGTVSVHLSGDANGTAHPELSEWYTVDRYGEGINGSTGEKISLMR